MGALEDSSEIKIYQFKCFYCYNLPARITASTER